MPVQYYRWDDAGAPQLELTRNDSSNYQCNIIQILDAILINGYGSKPGMGWTKLMTSEIEGSDRTVYQNNSVATENMNLIVQSNKNRQKGFLMQIADAITTPETYEHYSNVIATAPAFPNENSRWFAVGDERTLIFILTDRYIEDYTSVTSWDYYYPGVMYAGDMDDPDGTYSKPWCLLGPELFSGTIDEVMAANNSAFKGILSLHMNYPTTKSIRPVTQVPGEEWGINDCYWYAMSMRAEYFSNKSTTDYPIRTAETFTSYASVKAPWLVIMSHKYIFKLRGVYNIYPWITNCNKSSGAGNRNWLVELDAFGEQFFAFSDTLNRADDYYSPMTVYIQLTGSWT